MNKRDGRMWTDYFIMAIIILVVVAVGLVAHFDNQQTTPVWGKGELPEEWQGFFGNDNGARLDYAQTQRINLQGQSMAELVERVRQLEDAQTETVAEIPGTIGTVE